MVYSMQDFLYQLDAIGIYDVLLPFLLVFALVFGVMQQVKIFHANKGVQIIIAFVIGLLAINTSFFGLGITEFYETVFPQLGIGLVVILVVMILVGMFVAEHERKFWGYGLAAIGFIVAIVVLMNSFSILGWTAGYGFFSGDSVGWIIGAILIIGLIIAVAASGDSAGDKAKDVGKSFFNGIFGK
jgi:hypothetical protein